MIPDILSFFVRQRHFEAWKLYAKKCVNLRQILSRDKQRKTILKIICFLESVFGIEDGVGLVYLALGWYILYILSTDQCKISGIALKFSG